MKSSRYSYSRVYFMLNGSPSQMNYPKTLENSTIRQGHAPE